MTGDRHHETVRPGIKAYFTAGTPIVSIAREPNSVSIRIGDKVWSRDEFDADAPAGLKVVEEVFERHAQVLRLHVGRAIIGTTAEHPFWVVGKGWINANELAPGDTLIDRDGQEISVSQVEDTGEWATVYNMRVADWHTYFVGAAEWGFSVWAHNATYQRVGVTDDLARMALEHRKSLPSPLSGRNVMILEYVNAAGQLIRQAFVSAGRHTERMIPVGARVVRIFTEREPCRHCFNFIEKNFPTAIVTYLFPYRNKATRVPTHTIISIYRKMLGIIR